MIGFSCFQNADAEDLGFVTPECVRKTVSSTFVSVEKSDIAALSFHEKLLLVLQGSSGKMRTEPMQL